MSKCLAAAMAVLCLAGVQQARAEYALTILHINDVHSRIESINRFNSTCSAADETAGKCFGGMARIKAKLDERRKELEAQGRNVLTLDAGDQFQGSLFYTQYKGAAAAELMNATGFDAMAVGNHEFDDGPEGLGKFLDIVEFPVISGNTDVSKSNTLNGRLPGFVIVERGGALIGIVSTLAEDTDETSSPGATVSFSRAEDYLKRTVAALKTLGINKIIALTHMGLERDKEIVATVDGIDAVVGGHSHTLLSNKAEKAKGPYPVWVRSPAGRWIPIVQAYAYSKYLGEVEIFFDDEGRVINAVGEPHLLDASVTPDADMAERIAELAKPIDELKRKVVAETGAVVDADQEDCRQRECEMGNLVADAMLDRTRNQGVLIAIQNGGGLRASLDAGSVTMGELLTILPFQNTVATFEIKGEDLLTALENGVSEVEKLTGRFPQVAGLKIVWSRKVAPRGGRIKSVEVREGDEWVPLDPARTYGVVTNDYLRRGGDGYKTFAEKAIKPYDYGPNLENVLADYLAARIPYKAKLDGRISEVD